MPLIFILLAALAAPDTSTGEEFLRQGATAQGAVNHLCLLYHGQARRPAWTAESLRPYVAVVNSDNKAADWLFDSFLFIEFATDDGKQLYYHAKEKTQPDIRDWQWLADAWFRPDSGLIGLERCVAAIGTELGQPDHTVNVFITLPVPLREITHFGTLPGGNASLDFGNETDRQEALRWYVDTVCALFSAGSYPHLKLRGFYWTGESIGETDFPIVQNTSDMLHANGLLHYWIPYFSAAGVGEWRRLGFDAMMLQPNYFFDGDGGLARLASASRRAGHFGGGVEMEFDGRALSSEAHVRRFWDYLDAGAKYGWMRGALTGWYEGGGALGMLFRDAEKGRSMYNAVCRYVKGTYQPREPERLPNLPESPKRSDANLALASKGAKITGAINDGNPALSPEKMIDGDVVSFTGSTGLSWFHIPGSVVVELAAPAMVGRTQLLLFDLDDRYYSYTLETSPDGRQWEAAVDKSVFEARGWQVDNFTPRTAKYIRLTGLANSTGQHLMQVVELEVYPPDSH